jgi:hypothetical protein
VRKVDAVQQDAAVSYMQTFSFYVSLKYHVQEYRTGEYNPPVRKTVPDTNTARL